MPPCRPGRRSSVVGRRMLACRRRCRVYPCCWRGLPSGFLQLQVVRLQHRRRRQRRRCRVERRRRRRQPVDDVGGDVGPRAVAVTELGGGERSVTSRAPRTLRAAASAPAWVGDVPALERQQEAPRRRMVAWRRWALCSSTGDGVAAGAPACSRGDRAPDTAGRGQ